MATTSKKEVFVFVPERKQNRVKRRFAKRQTTLRPFTFVKDWQSPQVEVPHESPQKSAAKKNKEPVLNIVSAVSSSVSDPDNNAAVVSPASLSRVSPSPLVIPNQSPRARVFASNSQQRESSSSTSATDFRTPHSPASNKSHSKTSSLSKSSISSKSGPTVQSNSNLQSSTNSQSGNSSKSSRSLRSSKKTGARANSQTQQDEASSADNSRLTRASTRKRGGHSEEAEETEVAQDQSATPDEAVDEQAADLIGDGVSKQSELEQNTGGDRNQEEDRRGTHRPAVQSSAESLKKTPAEKSMSIIHRTPVSGPANRIAAKRRGTSTPPQKGAKQVKKSLPKPARSSPASKAKVRLWIGSGRHRTATDTTDLDIILTKAEDVSSQYRQNLSSKHQRKAIARFYQYVEKDLTDKIDLAQEYKQLKSSLSRMNITTRKQRKELLALQQRNARLDMQIAQMKKQASSKQEKDKALNKISTFLTDLQNLQKEYADTRPQDANEEYHVASDNLDVVLGEVKAVSQSRKKLRRLNNQLQDWLDTH